MYVIYEYIRCTTFVILSFSRRRESLYKLALALKEIPACAGMTEEVAHCVLYMNMYYTLKFINRLLTGENYIMKAEIETLSRQIKQSQELLRRYL